MTDEVEKIEIEHALERARAGIIHLPPSGETRKMVSRVCSEVESLQRHVAELEENARVASLKVGKHSYELDDAESRINVLSGTLQARTYQLELACETVAELRRAVGSGLGSEYSSSRSDAEACDAPGPLSYPLPTNVGPDKSKKASKS